MNTVCKSWTPNICCFILQAQNSAGLIGDNFWIIHVISPYQNIHCDISLELSNGDGSDDESQSTLYTEMAGVARWGSSSVLENFPFYDSA